MNSNIESQLRAIEREINALSANQAPNPADITTFIHSLEIPPDPNLLTVVRMTFTGGLKTFNMYLGDPKNNSASILSTTETDIYWGVASMDGTVFTIVSLSDFELDYG